MTPSLSRATRNRTALARQLLLERRRLPLPAALERVAGLQTQYAPTAYIGLWSRVAGFERDGLTRALERKTVVQGTLMRATIHTVSASDYPLMADGVRQARRDWWLRVAGGDGVDMEEMAAEADRLLADGPLRRNELVTALEEAGYPREAFTGLGLWLDLVRVPPSGTWERRRADLYQTAARWLGCRPGDARTGLTHLVVRYLRAFGPASAGNMASWAGTSIGMLTPSLDELQLRRFHDDDGVELFDLPRLPIVSADIPAPVRFLGPWEAILLVHSRPTGVLPEEYRPLLFHTENPHSVGSFLVDGSVAGAWRNDGSKVTTEPFAPIPRRWKRELEEEAEALAAFMA